MKHLRNHPNVVRLHAPVSGGVGVQPGILELADWWTEYDERGGATTGCLDATERIPTGSTDSYVVGPVTVLHVFVRRDE